MVFENVEVVLLGIMVLLTLLVFILSKCDILHPSVILCATMTWSVTLTVLMRKEWNLHIDSTTTIIFVTSILAFCFGSYWSERCLLNLKNIVNNKVSKVINVPIIIYVVSLILMVLCIYFNFKETYEASLALGNTQGYRNMIRIVRLASEHGEGYIFSRWQAYRTLLSVVITYYFVFAFLNNIIIVGRRVIHNLKYLIPVFFYFPIIILSGGRLDLLCLAIYILIVSALLYEKSHGDDFSSRLKIAGLCILVGLLFITLFLAFGFFTGKVRIGGRDPFSIVAHYGGLSVPALSVFISSTSLETPYIGLTTLWEFYNKLKILGLNLPPNVTFLNFTGFCNINTNVYTAMRRYIEDFGYIGMYLLMTVLGMAYTALYNYVKYGTSHLIFMAFYAMVALPLFLSINDDLFFAYVVRTTTVYRIVLLGFIYILINYLQKERMKCQK